MVNERAMTLRLSDEHYEKMCKNKEKTQIALSNQIRIAIDQYLQGRDL